ncbi:SRR1-like protein [Pygocentrus nattereri]|uniref:SRR1-like domain-containing protein n=1 Tax=Pygocentrus nattereri TaxID=42514 RepID=A0AAR2J793_PYGNA|nr:SRR1-like protein [Pygocentrus nattereri]
MSSSGEWQCVRRGKAAARRGKAARSEKPTTSEPAEPPEPPDRQRDTRRITEAVNDLRDEDFWLEWRDVLCGRLAESAGHSCTDKTVREDEYLLDCVCYGLGNFSSCVSARYQLAMLLLLFDALQIPVGQCSMYDPVFTVSEREILRELGFTVLTENEEGKRAVCRPTLFYLMHCGKALYNNLLWRNWSPHILPKVIVIGNSFLGIQERMLQRELERDYSFLSDIVNVCEETSLPCSQRFVDVFNDTALIRFPPDKLHKLPELIWANPSEPRYQHCQDLEIIQRENRS